MAIGNGVKDEQTAFKPWQTNRLEWQFQLWRRLSLRWPEIWWQIQKKSIKTSTFLHTCGQIHLGVVRKWLCVRWIWLGMCVCVQRARFMQFYLCKFGSPLMFSPFVPSKCEWCQGNSSGAMVRVTLDGSSCLHLLPDHTAYLSSACTSRDLFLFISPPMLTG